MKPYEQYKHPRLLYLDIVLVYIEAMKLEKGDMPIVILFKQQDAVSIYKNRWQIETSLKALTTKGFNLEDTHLNEMERINKLIAVVAVANAWRHKIIYINVLN